jgi:hypothetical protein
MWVKIAKRDQEAAFLFGSGVCHAGKPVCGAHGAGARPAFAHR